MLNFRKRNRVETSIEDVFAITFFLYADDVIIFLKTHYQNTEAIEGLKSI
jgi:hypothetical protein